MAAGAALAGVLYTADPSGQGIPAIRPSAVKIIVGVLTSDDVAIIRQLRTAKKPIIAIVVGAPRLAADLTFEPTVVTHSYRRVSLEAAMDVVLGSARETVVRK